MNPTRQPNAFVSVVVDGLSAVGVNLVTFVLGLAAFWALESLPLRMLVMVIPFGMYGPYLLLVGWYAFSQFRKGRRRRALLAGAIAPIVLIVQMMNSRIA